MPDTPQKSPQNITVRSDLGGSFHIKNKFIRPLTCDTENVSRVGGLFIFEIFLKKGVQNGSPSSNKWREKFVEEIFQKYPLFFSSQFKQVKGLKNIKEIFQNKPKMGVHFDTPCANEWRDWFFGKNFFEEISLKPTEMGVHFTTLCPNRWRDKYFLTKEYVNFLWTFLWSSSFWVCILGCLCKWVKGLILRKKIFSRNFSQTSGNGCAFHHPLSKWVEG